TDIDILNFALFTERLSSAVLIDGLTRFTDEIFENAGLPPFVRGRLEQMAQHDLIHINFLEAAISDAGGKPVPACDYKLSYLDPRSFMDVLSIVKSVSVSTYDGSMAFLAHKQLTTLVSSILGVEARHAAWMASAAQKDNPWSTAFETPLTRRHAFSLFLPYVNFPDNNPIRLDAFPPLTFLSAPVPGERVQFDTSHIHATEGDAQQLLRENHISMAFLTGEGIQYAPVRMSENPHIFEVTIPKNLVGIVYAIVTNSNKKLSDGTTIAGPALLNFRFNSNRMFE
ncbi:hypothetical protein M378DRAFT_78737, partial [Amanita muscaria Koide BX008]